MFDNYVHNVHSIMFNNYVHNEHIISRIVSIYRVAQKKRPITFESISALVIDIFA